MLLYTHEQGSIHSKLAVAFMNEYIKKWLNTRGISDDVIEKAEISYNGSHIVIPVIDWDGICQFNKLRRDPRNDTGAKYLNETGATATLYNAFMNKASHEVVVTEGELDTLALQSAGFPSVSSTGGAGTFKEEWADFFTDKDVYILYDYDEAGIKGALGVQKILPEAKIAWLPNCNDATDFLKKYTPEAMRDVLDKANKYPVNLKNEKEYRQAAELMIQERRELDEEALPAVARTLHTKVLQEYYLEQAKRQKKKSGLKVIPSKGKGSLDVEAAKQVPIHTFIDFSPSGKAHCLWHSDDHPSMHYYEEDNRVHCFSGCNKQWDVIDVVMKKYDKDFKEAVNYILANQ